MAALAVRVERARIVASAAAGRADLAAALMLVFVMAEVLLGRNTGFVRAVGRRRAPDQLERHDKQQEREHPPTHFWDSSLAVWLPVRNTGAAGRDLPQFRMGCRFTPDGASRRCWSLVAGRGASHRTSKLIRAASAPLGARSRGNGQHSVSQPGSFGLRRSVCDVRQAPSAHPRVSLAQSGAPAASQHRVVLEAVVETPARGLSAQQG